MKREQKILQIAVFLLLGIFSRLSAQENKQHGNAYVDDKGVIRWENTNEEVKGFGVNYSAPFAHAYRTAEKLGVEIKEAIDNDVYHFSRLGFDLYRIHVWDTEISDEEGNLLENEHLETFDYLLKQLKDRNINFMITPIAYWGNGWPEPDEDTPGFSDKYGKANSLTDPGAIKAQQNYLEQFLNHVNPYTDVAYKNEPNIIAFEISNEPHHKGTPAEVTNFINKMTKAMRSTGSEKPIFYNISHSTHLAQAYFDADIQGGTFQWYPTGLGFQKELEGNLLPNVNEYNIPFDDVITENNGAKIVYEFDAADVFKSYMYPAMARSFREAGIQIATHFAYDPTFMAYSNTEYNTHYMNLAYTPKKALALMIASKVFHEVPMNKDLGNYPENLKFGNFSIDYKKDLAVYNSAEEFIYTNHNVAEPKSTESLIHLAGYGNSNLVEYEGTGAYFLDKLEDGIWRLEVMPDAFNVNNPFGSNSLEKIISVINWESRNMTLSLPGLDNFSVKALNEGNSFTTEVSSGTFNIRPGTYILTGSGKSFSDDISNLTNIGLQEFTAPQTTVEQTYVVHEPLQEISEDSSLGISAEIISNTNIEKVTAVLRNGNSFENLELQHKAPDNYSAEVPKKLLKHGFLEYQIIVNTQEGSQTFPSGVDGSPRDWDFYDEASYRLKIVKKESPLYIFNASENADDVVAPWNPGNKVVPANNPGEAEYQVKVEQLFEEDAENLDAEPVYDYSFRYNFQERIKGRLEELPAKQELVIKARSLNDKPETLQVALVMDNGAAFGKIIKLTPEIEEYRVSLEELQPVKTVTLPRPYPSFLPYYFDHNYKGEFNLKNTESLQFSIGPGMEGEELKQAHALGIINIKLQ
ncbi:cellulase family glycosylhydrolase [Autumnicola musiva]|uniref:Cellulase family glycosylhydrolase n=1 Tax=Autumnicola musiva TaxID=3075589 RepID=A0ABU3D4U6_9FLAO|nr:cellulase family glycosylhydrolase [Zunongwangia sp. F117]MDT0676552.1 cellulase family glycosylhydrolase [Zunongwangia sp. F117]